MMKSTSLLALVGLLGAAAAGAEEPTARAAAEEKICRTEKSTETRIRNKRVCRTKAEWEQLARDTQADLRDSHRNTRVDPGNSR